VRARPETLGWIEGYYASMDAGRMDECDEYFAPDASLKIAHLPEITGAEAIGRVLRGGLAAPHVEGLVHEVVAAWEEDDGIVIFEVVAHYSLSGGRSVDVPGVVIASVRDGRFTSQRIAADLSPVYGAA
jgi:ketosteroid isomerase-like protein